MLQKGALGDWKMKVVIKDHHHQLNSDTMLLTVEEKKSPFVLHLSSYVGILTRCRKPINTRVTDRKKAFKSLLFYIRISPT